MIRIIQMSTKIMSTRYVHKDTNSNNFQSSNSKSVTDEKEVES